MLHRHIKTGDKIDKLLREYNPQVRGIELSDFGPQF
jgi:hypothetical protein